MANKNVIIQKKIDGVDYDLMPKTTGSQVYVEDSVTLNAKITELVNLISSKVGTESGKSLILDTLIAKLEALPTNTDLTAKINTAITDSKSYTDTSISALGNLFTIKGIVATKDDLPATGNKVGDVYFVGSEEDEQMMEYIWISTNKWEAFGFAVSTDLSGYYSKAEVDTKVNAKADTSALTSHTGNNEIHTTAAEKSKLAGLENYDDTAIRGLINNKADSSTVSSHTGNSGIHVTAAEKTKISESGRILTGTTMPTDMTEADLFFQILG